MPSSHLILCHSLLLLPTIPPSIRVFSNESTLCMRWPKYWSFSFSISPSIGWLKKLRAINSICNYTWVNIFQYKVKKFFLSQLAFCIRWPKYWSFSFSINPSEEHPGQISLEWNVWISLQSKGLSRVFSNTTLQNHQFFSAQLSSQSNSHIHT